MAQLDFYATSEDIVELVNFMFSLSPMKLYEGYSGIDAEIRSFEAGEDIPRSGHIDDNHGGLFLRGWWEGVTTRPRMRKFKLNRGIGDFRFELSGLGTFQLTQGFRKDLTGAPMDRSVFSHWNEAGARERAATTLEELNEVNWKALRALSGKVHRHVMNRMSVARLNHAHVLPGALSYLEHGGTFFAYPETVSISSPTLLRNHNNAFIERCAKRARR